MIASTPHQPKLGRNSQSLKSRNRVRIVIVGILFCLLFVVSGEQSLAQATCPCSIWDESATPALEAENDPNPIEVGVRFRSDVDGSITGIRFYKGDANVGPHVGNLWDANGQLLATVDFTDETASGWQQADFGAPVAISANTTYVASYHTESGNYALDENFFSTGGVTNPPLRALEDGIDGGNGVYVYGQSAFPTETYNTSNFWVDVVFEIGPDVSAPTVTATSPQQGATVLALDTNVTVAFNEAIDPSTIDSTTFELRDQSGTLVPATIIVRWSVPNGVARSGQCTAFVDLHSHGQGRGGSSGERPGRQCVGSGLCLVFHDQHLPGSQQFHRLRERQARQSSQ